MLWHKGAYLIIFVKKNKKNKNFQSMNKKVKKGYDEVKIKAREECVNRLYPPHKLPQATDCSVQML